MGSMLKDNFNLYTIAWFILLIAPFSYCTHACDAWGMTFVSIVMLIASIPFNILDIIFTVTGHPLSSTFLLNAAMVVSYLMIFSMAFILGFISEDFLKNIVKRT